MTLAALQRAFQAAVLNPAQGADASTLLRGNPRGLQAYRHAYPARLREALQDNYGVLAQALGDEGFALLAKGYLEAHPPTEPSIRWFGHALADFMEGWPDLPHPALADLARLDWALRTAFDAAACPPLLPEALAALPPARWAALHLRLQPHVQTLSLAWAVGPAWHALADARDAGREAELPPPEPLAHRLLVWRIALAPQWRSLDAEEAEALDALGAEPTLAAWLEARGEAALARSVALLQRWVADGLLIA